jgi:hypothetical protein
MVHRNEKLTAAVDYPSGISLFLQDVEEMGRLETRVKTLIGIIHIYLYIYAVLTAFQT